MELWHMKRDLSDEDYAKWKKDKEDKDARRRAAVGRVIRALLVATGLIILLCVVVGVYASNNEASFRREEAAISGEITTGRCGSPDEVLLTVHNGSNKTLTKVDFDMVISRVGESENLMSSNASFGEGSITSYTIIPPGQSVSKWCHPIPRAVVSACAWGCVYSVVARSDSIEFSDGTK